MRRYDMGACHREAQRRLFGYAWKSADKSTDYDEDIVQQIVDFHQNATHADLVLHIKKLTRDTPAPTMPKAEPSEVPWAAPRGAKP